MKKSYLVEWGEWAPMFNGTNYAVPSGSVDARTVCSRPFTNKKEALAFAKSKVNEPWLAYLDFKEVTLLQKLK